MASGDYIDASGTGRAAAIAANDGRSYWFGNVRGHCWRRYTLNDAATAAENGVYIPTGGADYIKVDGELGGDTASVRFWEEQGTAQPAATVEDHQVGSTLSADFSEVIYEPSMWFKSEISAHSAGTAGVTVLAEVHYLNGRP